MKAILSLILIVFSCAVPFVLTERLAQSTLVVSNEASQQEVPSQGAKTDSGKFLTWVIETVRGFSERALKKETAQVRNQGIVGL